MGSRLLAWAMDRLLAYLKSGGATVRLPQVEERDLATLSGTFFDALKSGSTAISNHANGFLTLPLEKAHPIFDELEPCPAGLWEELQRDLATATGRTAKELWELAAPAVGRPRCPLQVVWALKAVPSEGGAARGLDEVEVLYAAVKRSRPAGEHLDGGPVRKCGQCGRREAMGGPDPAKRRQFQADLAKLPEVKQGLRFEAGEFLCPVCSLRRLAGYLHDDAFPSTSEIAASHWLWRIRNSPDLCATLTSLVQAARRVPGYEKNWADRAPLYYRRSIDRERRRAREDEDGRTASSLDGVETELRNLETAIHGHNRRWGKEEAPIPEKPPEYLAVVMFDGDDFGEQLRKDLDVLPGKVVDSRTGSQPTSMSPPARLLLGAGPSTSAEMRAWSWLLWPWRSTWPETSRRSGTRLRARPRRKPRCPWGSLCSTANARSAPPSRRRGVRSKRPNA